MHNHLHICIIMYIYVIRLSMTQHFRNDTIFQLTGKKSLRQTDKHTCIHRQTSTQTDRHRQIFCKGTQTHPRMQYTNYTQTKRHKLSDIQIHKKLEKQTNL